MDSIVALDIETTGLDPQKDAIIEIGAVRFNEHRLEGEWTSLVNPGIRIPPFITQLTGITDQMVLRSPSIRDVLPDLEAFVGNTPILGHSIRFDLGFLRRLKILRDNDTLDTYEMASVLLPNAVVIIWEPGTSLGVLPRHSPGSGRCACYPRAFLRLYGKRWSCHFLWPKSSG
jgi:DNA polymerase-3 subunit epsilon/ATP-dependent DNA helicase DinG